jgi:hypothetical protein
MDAIDVAFVGILTTFVAGLAGLLVTLVNGRADRRHARRLARDERLFEKRSAVYEDLLTNAEREKAAMERTYPFFVEGGSPPKLPEPLSDEEWWRLRARVAAFGSEPVRAAVDAYRKKAAAFFAQARTFRAMEAQGRDVRPDAYVESDRVRREAHALLEALASAVRGELASPDAARRDAQRDP